MAAFLISALIGLLFGLAGYLSVYTIPFFVLLFFLLEWLFLFYLYYRRFAMPLPGQVELLAPHDTRLAKRCGFTELQADLKRLGYREMTYYRFHLGSFTQENALWIHEAEQIVAVLLLVGKAKRIEYRLIRLFDNGQRISMNSLLLPSPFVTADLPPDEEAFQFVGKPVSLSELHDLLVHYPVPEGSKPLLPQNTDALLALDAEDNRRLIAAMDAKGLLREAAANPKQGRRLNLKGVWHVFRHCVFPFNLPVTVREEDTVRWLRKGFFRRAKGGSH